MILSQKKLKKYGNQIKNIINEKNSIIKLKLIDALVAGVGRRCISVISKLIHYCRQKNKWEL